MNWDFKVKEYLRQTTQTLFLANLAIEIFKFVYIKLAKINHKFSFATIPSKK